MFKVPTENVTETAAATTEPVSVATAKSHLRVDISDDDTLIGNLITAAREYCEKYCQRSFAIRTLRADISGFQDDISLPFGPVIEITGITYWDTDSPSVQQTWAATNYRKFYDIVERRFGISFESTAIRSDAVQITYRAGYSDGSSPEANDTPDAVNQAILLLVGDMYENREAQVQMALSENRAVKMLLDGFRIYR